MIDHSEGMGFGAAQRDSCRANEIVQYLADHGADFTVKDRFGRTPLEEPEFEAPKPTIELVRKLAAEAAQKKEKK